MVNELHHGLAVRRGLPVRQMARRVTEAADQWDVEAALRAVRHPHLELALEFAFKHRPGYRS